MSKIAFIDLRVEKYYYADLAYPYVGYVKKPLNVLLIPPMGAEFKYPSGDLLLEARYEWAWYEQHKLHERIAELPKLLVKRFEIGHEYTNICALR